MMLITGKSKKIALEKASRLSDVEYPASKGFAVRLLDDEIQRSTIEALLADTDTSATNWPESLD